MRHGTLLRRETAKDQACSRLGPSPSEHELSLLRLESQASSTDAFLAIVSRYSDLVQEWKTGRPVQACEKGDWEDDYTQLHADMMAGRVAPKLLEFSCAAGDLCGGIADRCALPPSDPCERPASV